MEHRWGERVAVSLSVELCYGSAAPVAGSLENVSASGAFVRTRGRRPPRGPVEVTFAELGLAYGPAVQLPAFVVRETAAGVGIEWCEFAPPAVRELISMRHFPCEPNTAMQPRAQPDAALAAIGTNTLPVAASAATEWALGPVGQLPIQRLVAEFTTPSTGPPVLATAAR